MDAARAAAQSWPDQNPNFIWPPPQKRKRPAPHHQRRTSIEILSSNDLIDTAPDRSAQRAIATLMARAARLDRDADLMLSVGRNTQAERLSRIAATLREVAA